MVTRDAKISQYAIKSFHVVVAHPVLQIAKIAAHEGKAPVIGDVLLRIGILVETIEMAFVREMMEYFIRVAAAPEGHIGIDAVGLNIQPGNALL